MNKKEIALGIGIALAVLVVFTASAEADNVVFFDPDPSCAAPGETITVTLWLNATDGMASMNDDIHFDLNVVNITSGTPGDFPLMWGFVHYGTKVRFGGWTPDGLDRTGLLKLADLTLVANNPGTSELGHGQRKLADQYGAPKEATWINGTFLCPESFNKSLLSGWNLVSLPLTPIPGNNSTSKVLETVGYDAVYSYDATSHSFVNENGGTMDPGIGYFVHVTSDSTWIYNGTAYTSMSIDLESGLNMVGWLNCTEGISDTNLSNSSLDYYVASWNATAALPSFETYNPVAPNGFNDFDTMERGTGYFISAKAASTLEENCP